MKYKSCLPSEMVDQTYQLPVGLHYIEPHFQIIKENKVLFSYIEKE